MPASFSCSPSPIQLAPLVIFELFSVFSFCVPTLTTTHKDFQVKSPFRSLFLMTVSVCCLLSLLWAELLTCRGPLTVTLQPHLACPLMASHSCHIKHLERHSGSLWHRLLAPPSQQPSHCGCSSVETWYSSHTVPINHPYLSYAHALPSNAESIQLFRKADLLCWEQDLH